MNEKKIFNNTVLSFGILYAIVTIAFIILHNPLDTEPNTKNAFISFLGFFIFIGISVLAVWYYKKQGGTISLGKAVKIGVLLGLMGGSIAAVYTYYYFTSINPEAADIALNIARQEIEKKAELTPEMIDKQMELVKKMMLPMQVGSQIFVGMFYGLIGGILGVFFFINPTEEY